MEKKVEKLRNEVLGFLADKESNPEILVSAVTQCLAILMDAAIVAYGRDKGVYDACVEGLDKVREHIDGTMNEED